MEKGNSEAVRGMKMSWTRMSRLSFIYMLIDGVTNIGIGGVFLPRWKDCRINYFRSNK